jgi:hypothetical protein
MEISGNIAFYQPGQAAPASRTAPAQENPDREEKAESPADEPSSEEAAKIRELQVTDRKVRAHEQAHLAAAGGYARGGAILKTQRGPDGRMYAVGGEVAIDTSKVPDNPQATLTKAQIVRRAALAPADPSAADRAIAAAAASMAASARQDISAESREQAEGSDTVEDGGGVAESATQESSGHRGRSLEQRLEAGGAVSSPDKKQAQLLDLLI